MEVYSSTSSHCIMIEGEGGTEYAWLHNILLFYDAANIIPSNQHNCDEVYHEVYMDKTTLYCDTH